MSQWHASVVVPDTDLEKIIPDPEWDSFRIQNEFEVKLLWKIYKIWQFLDKMLS